MPKIRRENSLELALEKWSEEMESNGITERNVCASRLRVERRWKWRAPQLRGGNDLHRIDGAKVWRIF
jgi:hypothetical protein